MSPKDTSDQQYKGLPCEVLISVQTIYDSLIPR
jgi:hypothetical protein